MTEPLLLAASLLSGEPMGLPPQIKPEDDLWQSVDKMGLIDQQRVEAYQRRSQPLALQARAVKPESSWSKYSETTTISKSTQATYEMAYKLQPTPAIKPTVLSENPKFQNTVQPIKSIEWRSPSSTNYSSINSPSSGPELYDQRLKSIQKGQLYTRLKANSYEMAWADTTKQPTHEDWQKLLRKEANSAAKGQGKNRLGVLVGDSLSMWFPSEMLPEGKLWLNQGISGENSSQILRRLDALNGVHAETIYVMAGVNDLKQGASDATVLNNTRAIIRQLRAKHPESTVILQSLLPTRYSYLSPERAVTLNQQLQAIATQENAGYLNLHALFVDQEGKMRSDLSTDGLHLNHQGYEVWQGAMQQAENWVATTKRGGNKL